MSMIALKTLLRLSLVVLALVGVCDPGFAACTLTGANATQITSASSVTVTPPYDPSGGGDQLHNFTVTVSNPNTATNATCRVGLSFTRATLPATMSNGGTTLQYSLESTGGATLLQTTGLVIFSAPAAANRVNLNLAPGATANVTVRVRIPAGQTGATSGSYSDPTLTVGIYELFFGVFPYRVVDERSFTVNASITGSCTLPPPDQSTLNFTPAISSGLPNPGYVLTSTFSGVSCTAPSRIRLSGSPLVPTPALGSVAGFDNQINYLAIGQFGAASVALNTSVASQATSVGTNVVSGSVSGATITVDVNLLVGQRILAGNYSSVLTVTIDPGL